MHTMKCFILLLIFILSPSLSLAQENNHEYSFDKIQLECPTVDSKLIEYYKSGFEALNYPRLANTAGKIFFSIINEDKSLCDAYFYTGVALTKQAKHEAALNYYYYADSLSVRSNSDFKQELAEAAIRVHNIGLARKKYEELVKAFPQDPDGYYGIGLTATSLGDIDNGLTHLQIAEEKYKSEGTWTTTREHEVYLMHALLLTMAKKYKEAVVYFDKCSNVYNTLDDYNANYALATYNLYKETKEEKWKELSKLAFDKIKDKEKLHQSYKDSFQYE